VRVGAQHPTRHKLPPRNKRVQKTRKAHPSPTTYVGCMPPPRVFFKLEGPIPTPGTTGTRGSAPPTACVPAVATRTFPRLTQQLNVRPVTDTQPRALSQTQRNVRRRDLGQEKKVYVKPAVAMVTERGILDPEAQVTRVSTLNNPNNPYDPNPPLLNVLTCLCLLFVGCCSARRREHKIRPGQVRCSHWSKTKQTS
jgi:hypothetical protein